MAPYELGIDHGAVDEIENSEDVKEVKVEDKNFEDILEETGGFGWFQVLILFVVLFYEIPSAFLAFAPIFTGIIPKKWECQFPAYRNTSAVRQKMNSTEICGCNGIRFPLDSESIVSEWNLICSQSWVSDSILSIQMFGMFFGNVIPPQLSDWYGRKPTFIGLILLMAFGHGSSAIATSPISFAISRFLCGIGLAGYLTVNGIYVTEFLTPKWRQLGSCLGPLGEGIVLLALITYYIRPWRTLLLVTTLPFLTILVAIPFIPESPRWLLKQQRVEEAEMALKYMAKLNGKPFNQQNVESLKTIAEKESNLGSVTRSSYLDLFRRREVRTKTLIFIGVWFCWAFTYFGLNFNIRNFGVEPHLMLVYMGVADMIGFRVALLINNRIGRRKAVVVFTTVSALFFLPIAICQTMFDVSVYKVTYITFILLGKLAVAGARSSIRCLTVESYPIAIRTMGFGVSRIAATLGGIASPQLVYIGTKHRSVPMFAFATMGIFGSLLILLLKETSGKPLEDGIRSETLSGKVAPAENDHASRYQLKSAVQPRVKFRSNSL